MRFVREDRWVPSLQSLVSKLLEKKEIMRLGALGAEEVMKEQIFKGIDFADLRNKLIEAPFKPDVGY